MFSAPPGTYEICEVCDWEDDPVQLRFPNMRGGANKISLVESQLLALTKIAAPVQVHGGFRRASKWRPLRASEIHTPLPTSGIGYFAAAGKDAPEYYWESNADAI
jgi:hypothetical protein